MAGKKPSVSAAQEPAPLKTLKSFYAFMTEHGLESLELSEKDFSLRLVRRKAVVSRSVPVPVAAAESRSPLPPENQAPPPVSLPSGVRVKSPMMGIFYRASSPSSPPFVKEGEAVKAGHVICMIEAMKVFNEVRAEFPCTVAKILVENGRPVKAGQDLFIVER